jgi:hypothetical protein
MSHHIGAYLVSLAVGYWVLTLADKQNGFTKTLGKVVGWIILVVSLCGPLCMAGKAMCLRYCPTSESCPWNEGGQGWGGKCHMGMDHCMESGKDGKGMMMDGMKDKGDGGEKAPAKSKDKSK